MSHFILVSVLSCSCGAGTAVSDLKLDQKMENLRAALHCVKLTLIFGPASRRVARKARDVTRNSAL